MVKDVKVKMAMSDNELDRQLCAAIITGTPVTVREPIVCYECDRPGYGIRDGCCRECRQEHRQSRYWNCSQYVRYCDPDEPFIPNRRQAAVTAPEDAMTYCTCAICGFSLGDEDVVYTDIGAPVCRDADLCLSDAQEQDAALEARWSPEVRAQLIDDAVARYSGLRDHIEEPPPCAPLPPGELPYSYEDRQVAKAMAAEDMLNEEPDAAAEFAECVAYVLRTGRMLDHHAFDADGGCCWICRSCGGVEYPNRPCGCREA